MLLSIIVRCSQCRCETYSPNSLAGAQSDEKLPKGVVLAFHVRRQDERGYCAGGGPWARIGDELVDCESALYIDGGSFGAMCARGSCPCAFARLGCAPVARPMLVVDKIHVTLLHCERVCD